MSAGRKSSWNWKHAGICFAICLAAFAALWAFRQRGGLEYLELKTYDALLRSEKRDYSFSSHFLIVGMDDADIDKYGYPIPDETLQKLIAKLQESGPRAIGVDIIRDVPIPPHDFASGAPLRPGWNQELNKFLNDDANWNVTWVAMPGAGKVVVRAPGREDQWGCAETAQDPSDQCIRHALLFANLKGKTYPSLAYQLAINYLQGEPKPVQVKGDRDLIQIGPAVINRFHSTDGAYIHADDGGYQYLLDYRGPRQLPQVSVRDILDTPVPPTAIRDKIIIIGVTTFSNKDFVRTPVNDQMFGVVYHGIAADNLLRFALHGAHPITSWSDNAELAWTLGWAMLGGLVGYRVRSPLRWAFYCFAGVAILYFVAHLQINRGVWIPLLPPAILWVTCAALVTSYISNREKQDRAVLMKLFSSQVSGAVAQEIWGNREELISEGKLVARELHVTVLFTDLKGFTALAQTMSPADLMVWLNEYMGAMSKIVEKHGGIVNKYMGDAIMAIFGAPVPTEPAVSSHNAVSCALEMRTAFGELKLGWKMRGLPELSMRVGIHTGPLVVGTLGGADRAEYTVIGDTVNTAQRIESYDKDMMDPDIAADGCRIIIGDATRQLLDGHFRLRTLGEVKLSGRKETLCLHGVIQ